MPPRAETAEAVRYLTAALALRSDSAYRLPQPGHALMAMRRHGWGHPLHAKAALRVDPNYATAHYFLADVRLLGLKKDIEGAIREFQAALRIHPNDPEAALQPGPRPARQEGRGGGQTANTRSRSRSIPDHARGP